MVEFKAGPSQHSIDNLMIIIPGVILIIFISFVVYRLVSSYQEKSKKKEEKAKVRAERRARTGPKKE